MFRPSQALLFRPMPILNKLKLHHPLPLNARESKQLLNLLTTSFRQQLDSEHPQFRLDTTKNPVTRHEQARKPRRHSFSGHEKTPTDRHMHSLLSNPLFNPFAEVGGARQALSRDPMDIFDQAVSKGMMTIGYAEACLVARKAQITRSSILDIREGMKDSGAGLKVLKWLVSSGTANNIDFLKNVSFSTILLQYMVAENLQEVAWKWIKKSLENAPKLHLLSGPEFTQARRQMVEPLMLLIRAEASNQVSLDAAYIALSRAAGYLKGLSTIEMIQVLGPPGRYLIRKSLLHHSARPSPSEASFESFLSLIPVITKLSERYLAHLSLLHPTKPSSDLALAYIQNIQASPTVPRYLSSDLEHQTIQLGLDAAKVLLEQHRYLEADDVMDFLRVNYSNQLGIRERRELEQAKAEASSLEILAGLGLT